MGRLSRLLCSAGRSTLLRWSPFPGTRWMTSRRPRELRGTSGSRIAGSADTAGSRKAWIRPPLAVSTSYVTWSPCTATRTNSLTAACPLSTSRSASSPLASRRTAVRSPGSWLFVRKAVSAAASRISSVGWGTDFDSTLLGRTVISLEDCLCVERRINRRRL